MKIHNLLYHTNIILESEDDLFPGIGSSAFKELTPKDQRPVPGEDLESLRLQYNNLSDHQHIHSTQYSHLQQFLEDNDAFISTLYSTAKTGDVPYHSFDWLSKYEEVQRYLDSVSINKSSPLFKNIESKIRNLNNIQKRIKSFDDEMEALQKKINKKSIGSYFSEKY